MLLFLEYSLKCLAHVIKRLLALSIFVTCFLHGRAKCSAQCLYCRLYARSNWVLYTQFIIVFANCTRLKLQSRNAGACMRLVDGCASEAAKYVMLTPLRGFPLYMLYAQCLLRKSPGCLRSCCRSGVSLLAYDLGVSPTVNVSEYLELLLGHPDCFCNFTLRHSVFS